MSLTRSIDAGAAAGCPAERDFGADAGSTRNTNCGLARIASSAAAMPLSKSRSLRPSL